MKAFEEELGLTRHVDIAKCIGATKHNLSDWKKGQSSPEKWLLKISEATHRPMEFFLKFDKVNQAGDDSNHTSLTDRDTIRKEALLSYAAAELDLLKDRIGNKAFKEFLIKQLNNNTLEAFHAKQKPDASERKRKQA